MLRENCPITKVKGVGRYKIIVSVSKTSGRKVFDFLQREGFSDVERSENIVTFSMEAHEFTDHVCEEICGLIDQTNHKQKEVRMSHIKRISIAIVVLLLSSVGIYYLATTLVEVQRTTPTFQDVEVLLAGGIILLSLFSMVALLHLFTYYQDPKTGNWVFIIAYQNYVNDHTLVAEVAGLIIGLLASVGWCFFKGYFDIGILISAVAIVFVIITFGMIINLRHLKKKRVFKNIQQYFDTIAQDGGEKE